MKITIQQIDFDQHREEILALLKRNRDLAESYPYEKRYDWLYLKNPHGKATGWIVVDEDPGQIVGFTVALPRIMSVSGNRIKCWNCADFSIDPKYRTLGIAAKLRRGAKEAVDAGHYQFLYAHPNERMLAVHKRVGHSEIGIMRRYAKLLNIEGKADSLGNYKSLAKLVSPAANQLLNCVDKFRSAKHDFDIGFFEKMNFGEEFTQFFSQIESKYSVWGVRDATYLNWRYHQNPLYRSDAVIARTKGKIVGYTIFTIEDQSVLIKDILASEPQAIGAMIAAMSQKLRADSSCGAMSFIGPENHPYVDLLTRLGFHQRPESSSIIVHAFQDFKLKSVVTNGSNWFMTVGDRDE